MSGIHKIKKTIPIWVPYFGMLFVNRATKEIMVCDCKSCEETKIRGAQLAK
jgi:hypothetical protein